jgi:hypothetical protein
MSYALRRAFPMSQRRATAEVGRTPTKMPGLIQSLKVMWASF